MNSLLPPPAPSRTYPLPTLLSASLAARCPGEMVKCISHRCVRTQEDTPKGGVSMVGLDGLNKRPLQALLSVRNSYRPTRSLEKKRQ